MAEMYDQNQEERERFDEKPMGSSAEKEREKENPYRNYSKPFKPAKPVTTSNPVLGAQGIVELTEIRVSASVTQVPPSEIVQNGGFDFALSNIIPSENISGSYAPSDPSSSIELFIYDYNRNIVSRDYNYQDWKVTKNTEVPNVPTTYINDEGIEVIEDQPVELTTDIIEVNPAGDAYDKGIDNGDVFVVYNFLTNELASNADNPFYLDEISGDRTEIRLRSNTIKEADIRRAYLAFTSKLNSSEYFDEFYVNFYNNDYAVGINCILEDDEEQGLSVLIKTYSPIPSKFSIGDQLYVVTKPSETIAYLVDYVEDFSDLIDKSNYIKGPNVNISLQELVNNSTTLKSYEDLTNTSSSSSLDSVLNVLNQKGVTITPNYSYNTFNEFVNFSSAKARINNFYEKVSQIQSYQADIDTISATTGSNPTVGQISQSLASLQTNITNLIENFDGYETYLYQNSSSFAYPKTGSSYPYTLLPTGSTEVLEWMGSDVENSQYYGGIILSASVYDENNQNWLYYTIPDFITENADNDNYVTFTNMVGQSFDEIWLYTKALSERYNTINDPDRGLPLDLAADAIKNLGFETFGNNYDNQDNFIGLTGEDNGVYVPPTGSELITQYIAINNGQVVNYWDIGYSWLNYVQQINEPGFPYAIDKVSKEIYKRLYHNMAYLTKKKGTISGLRQLINIWGIPNTILRINEFGGKNRDNTDDYDLWYNRYSYAYTPVANTYAASSSVRVPWMPLQRNLIADSQYIVPDGVALRFKTFGHPSSSFGGSYYSQSIAVKKSNGTADDEFDWGIGLFYEDQPSGSYSGSSFSDYYDYGKLRFYLSGSAADGGVAISDDIELPFFDGGWWTVLLQRDQHVSASDNSQGTTYTLYAGNKLDNGWDGNNIGWTGSVSMSTQLVTSFIGYDGGFYEEAIYDNTSAASSSVNASWNSFGTTEHDGVYVGGYISGSKVGVEVLNEGAKILSGSLQEFRYYSNNIAQTVFNDFVMNPESVEGNNVTGSESSFDIVNFRAPLGNELEHTFTSSYSSSYSENISSSHPAITGSAPSVITSSFIDPTTSAVTSSYEFIHFSASTTRTFSKTNVETYFLDQPSIGVRNRVSNKIQIDDGEVYGNVLSKYRSIQQNYLISESYTEDTTGLEVGFSPQDEVNDDIIATYGYGVISDTLADPRFAYSGSQTYYPQLRRTAEDYFKKYTEGNVWDYLRLIKYFDNSIFKAIKSYVPARTSVTTGVIIKQHMLERNRRVPVTVDPNTVIAFTPETGSVVGGQSTITGNNSPISFRNLEITGSIDFLSVTGSTGGTLNRYNGEVTQSFNFNMSTKAGGAVVNVPDQYINIQTSAVDYPLNLQESYTDWIANRGLRAIQLKKPFKGRFQVFREFEQDFSPNMNPDEGIGFVFSSSVRGVVGSLSVSSASLSNDEITTSSPIELLPEELFTVWIRGEENGTTPTPVEIQNISMSLINDLNLNPVQDQEFFSRQYTPVPYSSSIHNQYVTQAWVERIDTISGSTYTIHKSQEEFYNGEFSGSEFIATTQSLLYNPYAPSQTLDTNYVLQVSSSRMLGTGGYYQSASVTMSMFVYPSIADPDQIYTDMENFTVTSPGNNSDNRGAIFLKQGRNATTNFWIYGLILPGSWNDGVQFDQTAARAFGFNVVGSNVGVPAFTPMNVPFPPAFDLDGSATWTETFNSMSLGPYLKLDISGSLEPTAQVGAGDPAEFADTGLLGNLNSAIIVSSMLGNNSNVARTRLYKPPVPPFAGQFYNILTWTNPETSGQRPVLLNGIPLQNPSSSWKETLETTFYYSNYDKDFTDIFNKNVAQNYGSASLYLQGTTWTGSYADSGYFVPRSLVFSQYNYDRTTGELIDNQNTIVNNPSFTMEIFNSQSQYSTPITGSDGRDGNLIIQSENQVEGVVAFTNLVSKPTYGYQYNPYNSRYISGTGENAAAPVVAQYLPTGSNPVQFVNFDPQIPPFADFYNTPYNSLINNVTQSVPNTYLQIVEYEGGSSTGSSGVPSNIIPITNNTAEKARIPDSFYTQQASVIPRYFGSKLQSANYNTFTPSGSSIVNLDAFLLSGSNSQSFTTNTGSIWTGDNLPGTMRSTDTPLSTVFKAPIYFAHYKSSKQSAELFGTYTFNIDALIQVPFEDITGDKAPELPVIIKVDGSGENITNVRSTFEVDRKALISYNQLRQVIAVSQSADRNIRYDSLPVGNQRIYQGAMEYQAYNTSQDQQLSYNATQSYITSSLTALIDVTTTFASPNSDNSSMTILGTGAFPSIGGGYSGNGRTYYLETGSGYLQLYGGGAGLSGSMGGGIGRVYAGALALYHSYNQWVSKSIYSENSTTIPGLPSGSNVDPNELSNYFRFNFASGSGGQGQSTAAGYSIYEDFSLPFLIEVGDEIRVTYNSSGDVSVPIFVTQDFTVTEVGSRADYGDTGGTTDIAYPSGTTALPITGSRVFDRIKVYPNPDTLEIPIDSGEIYNFTLRRRVNADDRVIVFQTPPTNVEGARTPSPSGYLVPSDMTPIQKRNVRSLITQLNAKNAFSSDAADQEPIRGEGF